MMLCSAVMTGLLLLFLFGYKHRLPGEEYTFLYSDGFSLYSNFIAGFWRQLLSGEGITYSFSASMGMPTLAAYNFVFSPFNLCYLIFPDPDTAACVATFLKLMIASAFFSLLLKKMLSVSARVGGVLGIAYGLCGYAINFYYIYSFLDQLYMLPVLVFLLWRMLKTGHWKGLCIAYTYLFVVQIYGGYLNGIFTGGVFLVLAWYYFGKNISEWKKAVFLFARSVLIAILISMVFVFPEMVEMFRYTEPDAEGFNGTGLKAADLVGALYIGVQGGIYNHWPAIYSTILAIVATIAWFLDRNNGKRKKIAAGIILLFLVMATVIDPIYLFFHAGNNPDGIGFRFSYMYSFVFLFLAAYQMERVYTEKQKHEIWIFICGAVLYIAMYFAGKTWGWTETVSKSGIEWNSVFILIYVLILLLNYRHKKTIILIVLIIELMCNGILTLRNEGINISVSRKYYESWQRQLEGALSEVERQEQEDPWLFYRLYIPDISCPNVSMRYGYYGLGMFGTVEHWKMRQELQRLGYSGSSRTLSDYGSDPFMQMLFAQKYSVFMPYQADAAIQPFAVVKNAYTLPLGYMVSSDIIGYSIESTNAFENRNTLAQLLTGKEHCLYREYLGPLSAEMNGLEVEQTENRTTLYYSGNGETARLDLRAQPEIELPLYMYISRWGYHLNIEGAPEVITSCDMGTNWTNSSLTMPHIQLMPANEEGFCDASIIMEPSKYPEIAFENLQLAYYDAEEAKQIYDELSAHPFVLTSFGQKELKGIVEATDQQSVLFTSIPYDDEWHAEVDGEETETISVLDEAFLAVPIAPGVHNVRIYYRNDRIAIGCVLSLIGILAFLTVAWSEYKTKDNGTNVKNM